MSMAAGVFLFLKRVDINNMNYETTVALSSDTTRDYAFVLPLTALFWRDIVLFDAHSFLVGSWLEKKNKVVLEAFDHHNLKYHMVGTSSFYATSTIAQNCREHAAAIFSDEDLWLMPGDADLWPFKREFYRQHLTDIKAASYYSNGDHFQSKEAVVSAADRGEEFKTLPTCHVAMKVGTWRELYGYESTDLLRETEKTLDVWLKPKMAGKNPSDAGWEAWMSDQRILTERVCRADWFPQKAKLIPRNGHPPVDRLDRGNVQHWTGVDLATWTDAHLVRAPDENWSIVRPLIAHYLPQHLNWADNYREQYIAAK